MKKSRYQIKYNGLEEHFSIIDKRTKKVIARYKKLQHLMYKVNHLRRKEATA